MLTNMTTTNNANAPNVPAIDWLFFSYLTAERGAVYRAVIDVPPLDSEVP